ncbi:MULTISPECIES: hypothetical protein [unclassified Mycobacterium]|uniref:Rv0361 family membrane protein n=1 Tax=unclassified Mycobacterium TaxID=2642494 RepID=UPI0029C7868B|nr:MULTISPECIES: hypothetical protein [unclassified Mycobacterium]
MRFNPPPNWPPSPPGWTPPPGWRPDPSWPPPPPGWQLWASEGSSNRKNGLIIGGLVAVLLLVVGAVITVVLLRSSDSTTTKSTQTSASQKTDDEQIEDAVKAFEKAWNDRDFDGFKPILCLEMRSDKEFNEEDFLDARGESGELNLDVESVEVDGEAATATVTRDGEDADDIDFVREDGSWKWCKL